VKALSSNPSTAKNIKCWDKEIILVLMEKKV
jgi:hypothetical protein